ncbi:hypothetical protein Peur_009839 [Populus x canadensis]
MHLRISLCSVAFISLFYSYSDKTVFMQKELNSVKEQVVGFSCLNYQIQIGFQGFEVPPYRVLLLQLSKCMRSLFTCFLLDFNECQASKSNEVIRASFYLYSEFLPLDCDAF